MFWVCSWMSIAQTFLFCATEMNDKDIIMFLFGHNVYEYANYSVLCRALSKSAMVII